MHFHIIVDVDFVLFNLKCIMCVLMIYIINDFHHFELN